MKLLYIFLIHKAEPYFIQNQNKPICANCKYFIPNKNECSKFGTIDIVTNEHHYEQALTVRKDDRKCGDEAIFFKTNYFKFITIPYYFFIENSLLISLPFIIISPSILFLFMMK
jgi:hypothetical protein